MKKNETICSLLGISQMEMAMLLKITRSQWSMYESGKRDLPLAAKVLLAEMLAHVQSAKATALKNPSQLGQQETKEKLQASLKENQHQQTAMEKKVAALEKKQTAFASAQHSIDYLENHTDKKQTHMKDMSKVIQYRANKDRQLNGVPMLVTYQIKQKVLQYEEELLKAALKNTSTGSV